MPTVPITPRAGKLPWNYEFTPDGYRPVLLQRMELCLRGEYVLLGTTDAAVTIAPARNIGGWFNPTDKSWWAWNEDSGQYEPIDIGLASGSFGVTLNGAPSTNRTLTVPDRTGTALLSQDVSIPKETVVLTGTTPTIDANLSNNFILTLAGNTTIQPLSNMSSGGGKKIKIAIINSGTAYTVTWPTAGANEIKWPASPSHTQPSATTSQPEALAIYTISEANVGLTAHLWGDPEVTGFNPPEEIQTGGPSEAPSVYGGGDMLPPPKGRNPYLYP